MGPRQLAAIQVTAKKNQGADDGCEGEEASPVVAMVVLMNRQGVDEESFQWVQSEVRCDEKAESEARAATVQITPLWPT